MMNSNLLRCSMELKKGLSGSKYRMGLRWTALARRWIDALSKMKTSVFDWPFYHLLAHFFGSVEVTLNQSRITFIVQDWSSRYTSQQVMVESLTGRETLNRRFCHFRAPIWMWALNSEIKIHPKIFRAFLGHPLREISLFFLTLVSCVPLAVQSIFFSCKLSNLTSVWLVMCWLLHQAL